MNARLAAAVLFATLGALLAPAASTAQGPTNVPRIGFLTVGSAGFVRGPLWEGFQPGLREFGYVEGQNIVIEARYAERQPERLPALAAELMSSSPQGMLTFAPRGKQPAQFPS